MAFPDRRAANILLTILLFAAALGVLYAARHILLVFILAILLAYLADPAVRLLQRHSLLFKDLRKPAILEVYLAFLLLTGFAAHTVVPGLVGPGRIPFAKMSG